MLFALQLGPFPYPVWIQCGSRVDWRRNGCS